MSRDKRSGHDFGTGKEVESQYILPPETWSIKSLDNICATLVGCIVVSPLWRNKMFRRFQKQNLTGVRIPVTLTLHALTLADLYSQLQMELRSHLYVMSWVNSEEDREVLSEVLTEEILARMDREDNTENNPDFPIEIEDIVLSSTSQKNFPIFYCKSRERISDPSSTSEIESHMIYMVDGQIEYECSHPRRLRNGYRKSYRIHIDSKKNLLYYQTEILIKFQNFSLLKNYPR